MNPTEQIKALAELDGWTELFCEQDRTLWGFRNGRKYSERTPDANYLTSYDAIIPLIQKQPAGVMIDFTYHLWRIIERDAKRNYNRQYDAWRLVIATPAQLCEALLRATGKWKDQ